MTQPGHQQGDIPSSYQPAPPVQNFAAPSHHLSNEQSKEIVALAEASHKDTQGGFMSQNTTSSGSGLTGSSGFGSSATDNIASTLGGGTGSATRSHGVTGGEYERTGNDLTGNRTGLTSGSGLGSSSNNYDSTTSSSSHSHGLGAGAAGAGAAGAAGAGVYGSGIGSHGDSNARGGASAVAAKQGGRGGELTDHDFKNTAPSGTLENKLQDELERNARKAGTHASGFGVQGTPAGSASLGSGTSSGLTSGLTGNSTSAGYGTSGQQYGSSTGTGIGSGHHSSAAPLAGAAGLGAAGAGAGYGSSHGGLTGQQQGYPAGATTAVGQTGTGGKLADQIHGLGTERNLQQEVDSHKFGVMQDHKRSNEEAAHLPGTEGRRL